MVVCKKYYISLLKGDREDMRVEKHLKIVVDVEEGHAKFVESLLVPNEEFKLLYLTSEYVHEINIEKLFLPDNIYSINEEDLKHIEAEAMKFGLNIFGSVIESVKEC